MYSDKVSQVSSAASVINPYSISVKRTVIRYGREIVFFGLAIGSLLSSSCVCTSSIPRYCAANTTFCESQPANFKCRFYIEGRGCWMSGGHPLSTDRSGAETEIPIKKCQVCKKPETGYCRT